MPNLTGQSIGRYHILEQLGEGGMAIVYKAYDTRLERNVAVKVLRTDLFGSAIIEQILKRFEREAKSLAKLSHPNIVNILDYGEHEGNPYLVMEYLPGGTLKQKLGQAIPWQDAIQTLLPVARGLAYAHQHGVIHRDVKPANILMKEENVPVLTDFGIAKLIEGTEGYTLTGSGVGIGTPEYMAPEQGIGAHAIDARADIYSLGIVLYEMVTGRKPYIADTPIAVVLKQITDPLPRPTEFVPDLPEGMEHILFKALAKQPDDRYTDMNAMITAMESVLADSQKVEAPASTKRVKKRTAPHIRSSPKVVTAVIGALAVILVITFGGSWAIKRFSAESEAGATSTKISDDPSSTFTLLSPTKTLKPSPTPTLTKTPRLTLTKTPIPAWVTSFAEPVLAYIANRPPTFEDDFEQPSEDWVLWIHYSKRSTAKKYKIENGKLVVTDWPVYRRGFQFDDYVIEVDAQLAPDSSSSLLKIIFRDNNCNFMISEDSYMKAGCWKGDNYIGMGNIGGAVSNLSNNNSFRLRLIVKGMHFAFYVNGIPMGYFEHEYMKTGNAMFSVDKGYGWFDNFKVWNITDLKTP